LTTSIAELDVEELPLGNVDFDTAEVFESIRYRYYGRKASDRRGPNHHSKIPTLPKLYAYRCHDAHTYGDWFTP
jgi:hypothetical protein